MNGDTPHYNFAYILACGDPKISAELLRYFDNRFARRENYFWLPELGGIKNLSSPKVESDCDYVIRKMKDAYAVHPFGLVILINHSDCGKYRLDGSSFNDAKEEERFHTEELKKAAKVVTDAFPNMTVEHHYFLKGEQRMAW